MHDPQLAYLALVVGAIYAARWLVRLTIRRVAAARAQMRRQADEDALVAALRGDTEPPEGFRVDGP